MPRFVPDRSGFFDLARRGRLCFVYREVLADSDTPVSAYAKLGRGPYSFLLESVVGGEKWAAYSFVGVKPRAVIRARGDRRRGPAPRRRGRSAWLQEVRTSGAAGASSTTISPRWRRRCRPGLPRFFGGAVGWLGYDVVRSFEKLPNLRAR